MTENDCLLLLYELISNEFLYVRMASHVKRDFDRVINTVPINRL